MDWTRILPFLLVFVGYYSAEGADVSIQPATQKVTIGSQVVFTCESSMAGGTFRWLKSGKDINDEKDLVRIYSPSETISVLRIQRADPSIHRRTYSCVWYSSDGITVRENTKLKVLTPSRTHKNFPRISPAVQTSSIDGRLDTSQHFDLKCELTSDVDVTWRWIKDNFTDVSFMDEYNQGHLAIIKEGNSGILRIQQVGADDSGTYTCVADNNRGNAYGTSMKIAIKAEQPDGCTTENQGIVPVGTEFRNDYNDPCTTCQCVENGLIRCKSVGCGVPGPRVRRCRQGFEFRMSNDTCCEYDCFSKGNRSDRVSPGQGAGCLTDDKGLVPIGHNWTDGDPCTICECMPEGDVACSAVSCGMPNMQRCRRGQEFRMSDTECCKFGCYPVRETGSCRDRKGATVQQYEAYRPESDPCVRCQCYKGGSRNCITVACDRPTCEDYIPSTEVCCDYTCPSPAPPNPQKESECISADGSAVTDGTRFTSPDDPCLTCTCFRGKRGPCFSMTCIPPPCLDFDRIPGTCCEYKCPGDQEESYCIDAEGMKVADGETYTPPGDPCQSCSCDRGRQGRCATIYCDVPPCKHELIPGTCCGFKCIAGEGECLDSHGMVVANGDVFTPDGHGSGSCIECVCEEGELADCVSIVCDEPPCRNYELIPGTCCGFTCRDDIDVVEVDGQTTCVGFGGEVVQDGEPYAPGPDPCVSCTCNKGVGIGCRSVACMPPGPHCTIKPGTCCSFDCNNDNKPLEVLDPVEGQMLVQQVGSSGAIVQWQISEGGTDYMNQGFNFTVHIVETLRRKPERAVTGSGNRTHISLSDLDSNTQYQLRLNGTLGTGGSKKMLLTKPVMFQLQTRSRSSLAVNDALGAVFESRGAAHYDTYSIPRQFKPVSQSENVMNHVNVASFHRVEVSTYTQRPCPQDECGLVRFFMYNMEGECMNVMSLMFANDQDYVWAKAHL